MDNLKQLYDKIVGKKVPTTEDTANYFLTDMYLTHTICKAQKYDTNGLKKAELQVAVYKHGVAEYYCNKRYFSMAEIKKAMDILGGEIYFEDGFLVLYNEEFVYYQQGAELWEPNEKISVERYEELMGKENEELAKMCDEENPKGYSKDELIFKVIAYELNPPKKEDELDPIEI